MTTPSAEQKTNKVYEIDTLVAAQVPETMQAAAATPAMPAGQSAPAAPSSSSSESDSSTPAATQNWAQ
ncbi:MAG TPA: hypothetical protein VFG86_12705 [Chloroflexota bacterium]|nr:hypothetical protein [Chloroflexota bacterium]